MKKLTCIMCPLGCSLEIEGDIVLGNECSLGEKYAIEELKNPKRILTTTVSTDGSEMLPVRSDKTIPKKLIYLCMGQLAEKKVKLPVKKGQIIIKNILNTKVNIIASMDMVD